MFVGELNPGAYTYLSKEIPMKILNHKIVVNIIFRQRETHIDFHLCRYDSVRTVSSFPYYIKRWHDVLVCMTRSSSRFKVGRPYIAYNAFEGKTYDCDEEAEKEFIRVIKAILPKIKNMLYDIKR